MRGFDEAEIVDDRSTARFIAAKHEFILDPVNELMEKLKQHLNELVKSSNGVIKRYYLFGEDNVDESRRYPKRKRKFNPSSEDKSIYLGGIHVGYIIPAVPWLSTKAWEGIGVALNTVPKHNEV